MTIFIMAITLAIGGWWFSQVSPFEHLPFENPPPSMHIALAEGTDTTCIACHSRAVLPIVDYTTCTDCHNGVSAPLPPIYTYDAGSGEGRRFAAHHGCLYVNCTADTCQAVQCTIAGCPTADCTVAIVETCLDVACHNTSSDARYVVKPALDGGQSTGHAYAGTCHDGSTAFDTKGNKGRCHTYPYP